MKEDPFKSYNPLGLSNPTEKRKTLAEKKAAQERLHIEARIARPDDWEKLRDFRLAMLDTEGQKIGVSDKEAQKIKGRTDQEWQNVFREGEDRFSVLVLSSSDVVGIGRAINQKEIWWLFNLGVKMEFRGIGIGSRITAMRLNEIQARGGKEVWIYVQDTNTESIKNAESFGFRIVDTVSEKLSRIWNKGLRRMKLEDVNAPKVVARINEVLDVK